jgi:ligand-binding sensor domain-containing protein
MRRLALILLTLPLLVACVVAGKTPTTTPFFTIGSHPPTPTNTPSPTITTISHSPTSAPTAKPASAAALAGKWTTYTEKDGLAGNLVTALAVGPDGTLWAGTSNSGISRFDGQTWTTYTTRDGLLKDSVDAIAVTPNGTVWVGTWGGVSRFDPSALGGTPASGRDGQAWTTYTEKDGLAGYGVSTVAIAQDGTVWLGGSGGVSRFDGHIWTTYSEKDGLGCDGCASIAVAPDGTVWAGGCGVSHFDGEMWTTYTATVVLSNNHVTSIAVALDGTVWAADDMFGDVSRFDGKTWTTFTTEDGLPGRFIHDMAVTPDGAVWFGASVDRFGGGGVTRFDGQTWTIQTADSTSSDGEGLVDNDVRTIAVGPDRTLWFGTFDEGISHYEP